MTVGGQENIFMSASRSQFVAKGPATIFKISQRVAFLWPERVLNRDFALAREIIHNYKLSFYAIFLLEHDNLISCKCFVIFYDDFE